MRSFHTRSCALLLLLCALLGLNDAQTTPASEEIPRCNTSDMGEVNAVPTVQKSIDFWNCDQNLVHVRDGVLTTLINTLHESPSFVLIPSSGFEYFEVLFRRGTRSTVFHTQKISDLAPGQYILRIVFRFLPPLSYTPNLTLEVGITPLRDLRSTGNPDLNQFLDDTVWYANKGLKKYTCMGPSEPKQLRLSQILIRVQGASEWQYIPMQDFCSPENASRNSSNPNMPNHDPSRSFSDSPGDSNYVTTMTSINRGSSFGPNDPSSRTRSPPFGPNDPSSRTRRPPFGPNDPSSRTRRPPSPQEHSTTEMSHLSPTSQGPRMPRLNTESEVDHSTEEYFPSVGFVEDGVKNGTKAGLMRLSTPVISGIIGGLAVILLIIGCCVLFKNLNLRGSYGIHSSTYEAESSLHLRDSHYNPNTTTTTTTVTTTTPPTASDKPHQGAPSITINDQTPEVAGQVNQSMDMSQETANEGGIK